jgi:hypothetical protein
MRPAFLSPRCLPPEKSARAPFREPLQRRCLAGRRGEPPHVFTDVREHRLDLGPRAFTRRARGRVRSSGFCRTMFPRARLWTARTPLPPNLRWGRLPIWIESPRSTAITEAGGGQGPGRTVSPGAPRRDCSPRRLRPDLDRFGRLLSRPLPSRPVRSDVGRGEGRHRGARLQGTRATGPCGAELPRRNPTLTNPRHLPSQGRSRTNEGFLAARRSRPAGDADAFFTAE